MKLAKSAGVVLLLLSTSVRAEEALSPWSGDVDFGYTKLTGNSDDSTMTGKIAAVWESQPWKWGVQADALGSKSEQQRTAEKYGLLTRLSYNFTDKNYVFARATYESDKFSGYDYQATATAGLGWNLYDLPTFSWDVELGAGFRTSKVDQNALGEDENEPIVTAGTVINYQLSDSADFNQYLSYEKGSDIDIFYSSSELAVKIIDALAMKLSYNYKYTSDVPVGTNDTDTETIVSLSYSF
ncbi:YdiY family protein [Thalassotalea maritima]|uniref:DUF481 domain-containing protein n=1 Tax=Thalassotalea maritima TaxID=3242416 RepID=UPI003527AD5B